METDKELGRVRWSRRRWQVLALALLVAWILTGISCVVCAVGGQVFRAQRDAAVRALHRVDTPSQPPNSPQIPPDFL